MGGERGLLNLLSEVVMYELTDCKTFSLLYKSHGELTAKCPFHCVTDCICQ